MNLITYNLLNMTLNVGKTKYQKSKLYAKLYLTRPTQVAHMGIYKIVNFLYLSE